MCQGAIDWSDINSAIARGPAASEDSVEPTTSAQGASEAVAAAPDQQGPAARGPPAQQPLLAAALLLGCALSWLVAMHVSGWSAAAGDDGAPECVCRGDAELLAKERRLLELAETVRLRSAFPAAHLGM